MLRTFGSWTRTRKVEKTVVNPPSPGEDFKSPYGISPDDIFNMLSPPSAETFKGLGYAAGMAKLLKSDLKRGLHIVDPKAVAVEDDVKAPPTTGKSRALENNQTNAIRRGDSTVTADPTDTYVTTKDDVEARKAVFGTNQMPEPILKSLWSFVTDAYQDKMLILLTVAAMVEIAIGSYKAATKYDNLELIDGFAVLFAGMHIFPPFF